jgi:hypothetical protein
MVKFVDVDVQSIGDPNVKIQDLEDQRREIIAISGVPAPYLGYNDVVDLREELVNINIVFATNIINIQDIINIGISELIDKSYDIIFDDLKDKPTNYIVPILKPPVLLLLQMLESTISSVGNIQLFFQNSNLDVNPYYFLKLFIPSMNWDEFQREAKEYALFKQATSIQEEPGNNNPIGGGGSY